MRWFRFYDDAVNDPKILRLPDGLFRIWVGLLCLASKNDGILPTIEDMCVVLRLKPSQVDMSLTKLLIAGLIDQEGDLLTPHNWDGRQFKSDVSNDRVKRYRERKRNVTVTPPDTDTDTDTDTEADTEKKKVAATPLPPKVRKRAKRSIPDGHALSDTNHAYCRSLGFSDFEVRREHQKFCMHAKAQDRQCVDWDFAEHNWLTKAAEFAGKRPRGEVDIADDGTIEVLDQLQLEAWDAYGKSTTGKPFPRNKKGGWRFPSKWPPGHEAKMIEGVQKILTA